MLIFLKTEPYRIADQIRYLQGWEHKEVKVLTLA